MHEHWKDGKEINMAQPKYLDFFKKKYSLFERRFKCIASHQSFNIALLNDSRWSDLVRSYFFHRRLYSIILCNAYYFQIFSIRFMQFVLLLLNVEHLNAYATRKSYNFIFYFFSETQYFKYLLGTYYDAKM